MEGENEVTAVMIFNGFSYINSSATLKKASLNNRSIHLLPFLLIFSIPYVFGQKPFAEIQVTPAPSPTISAIVSGDSILLVYKEASFIPTNSMWFSTSGTKRNVDIEITKDRTLIQICSEKDVEKYYYVEYGKKSFVLSCLTLDVKTGSKQWDQEQLEVPGILLGSYVDGDLFLVCTDPKEPVLKIIRTNGSTIKELKTFELREPLIKGKRTSVTFSDLDLPLTPDEATASVKIFKQDSVLLISTDESYDEYAKIHGPLKTGVYRINIRSGRSDYKIFMANSEDVLHSTIFNNCLYRLVRSNTAMLQIFDLTTSRQTASFDLSLFKDAPNSFAYLANDDNHNVLKTDLIHTLPLVDYVIPDTVSSTLILRVGARMAVNPNIPLLSAWGLPALMVSFTAQMVLLSKPAVPAIDIFFYLKGSPEGGFYFTADSGLLSQTIANYEFELTANPKKYQYKTYLFGNDCAFGIYLERKSDKIQIQKFSATGQFE